MEKSYRHLSVEERTIIQTQLAMGMKKSVIACGLGRSASTVSREQSRNGWVAPSEVRRPGRPALAGGYRAEAAQERARTCTVAPRVERRLQPGNALWGEVTHHLKRCYSLEQIAGTLSKMHDQTPVLQVFHETIYTSVYAMPRGELRTEIIGWLRFGHAKRRPRARGEDPRGRITDMLTIH